MGRRRPYSEGKFDEDNGPWCGNWTNHFGDMEEGSKSLILQLWCLPCQTLSTPGGIAHTNSVLNVKHTELNQQTPGNHSSPKPLNPLDSIKSSKGTQGKIICFQPQRDKLCLAKVIKDSGTHSWASLGSWKARIGIWLMRFRLSLRTCRVEPRWSSAPSCSVLILLLLRYLEKEQTIKNNEQIRIARGLVPSGEILHSNEHKNKK